MKFLLWTLALASALGLRADDWPQWLGPQRDGVWRETGILEKFPTNGLKILWRTEVGGGYSSPAIAKGRVYVTDRQLATNTARPKDPFNRSTIPGTERILCLDEKNGKVLWKHEYDCTYSVSYSAGPRISPLIDSGKVYTVGTEGNLFCLNAADGKVVWSRDFKKDFGIPTPLWGFAGHPLIDGNKLICLVGGSNSVAVAFDKRTGKELWRALGAKEPGYCPPMIYTFAGKRQLILWHAEAVNSLNPETGAVNWTFPWKINYGLSLPAPRKSGDLLFLTCFYNGSLMLRLTNDTPEVVWRSKKVSEMDTDGLHSIMPTPVLVGDYIYGVCSYGQLRGLKKETGDRLWSTLAATGNEKETRWANAFIIPNGKRYFLFNEKGDLIIANLSPEGYQEISRAHLIDPTNHDPGRDVVWCHPAFANRTVYVRNDKELVAASLAKP